MKFIELSTESKGRIEADVQQTPFKDFESSRIILLLKDVVET